tara:strand:- start:563 stop:1309 length:747 start_codon:yes stop_codon:yes gene_type:complete
MIISSENFVKTCDVVLDPHYNPKMLVTTRRPRRVFVSGERCIFEQMLHVLKSFETKYELIYHRTDYTFDRFKLECVKPYVSKIYAINCDVEGPVPLPIGFADGKEKPLKTYKERNILCYLNVSLYNNELQFVKCRSIREDCINYFKNKSWVRFEEPNLTQDEFNSRLQKSKFVLCPFGFGLDTHRFYEVCAAGSVPIVMTSSLDNMYKQFGALIVKNWSEVTQELLEDFTPKNVSEHLFNVEHYISDQ